MKDKAIEVVGRWKMGSRSENEQKGSQGQWIKKKGGSDMGVEWLDHLWTREVEWGHILMSAHLDWLSFISPPKRFPGLCGNGLVGYR